MTKNKISFWDRLVSVLKPFFTKEKILAFLKKRVVTTAIKKIATITSLGGVKGWLVTYIVEHLYDEVGQPIALLSLRKIGYTYRVIEGNILISKLDDALEEHNEQDYNDTIDDILS